MRDLYLILVSHITTCVYFFLPRISHDSLVLFFWLLFEVFYNKAADVRSATSRRKRRGEQPGDSLGERLVSAADGGTRNKSPPTDERRPEEPRETFSGNADGPERSPSAR